MRLSGCAVLVVLAAAGCGGSTSGGAGSTAAPPSEPARTTVEAPTTTTVGAAPFDSALCAEEVVERDLDVPPALAQARATVSECQEPGWAVVSWDLPGDSQRIVHLVEGVWATYVEFPHDLCRTQARTEGVPESMVAVYFHGC